MMFVEGRIADFVVIIGTFVVTYIFLWRGDKGHVPKLRKIAGLERIEELVGRCVELDKPIHVVTGTYGGLIEKEAATNLAGLSVLGYVTRLAARFGGKVIFSTSLPEVSMAAEDIMRTSYAAEGKPDIKPDNRYTPGQAFYFKAQEVFYLEGAAAQVVIGLVSADCLYYTSAARDVGAIQVAGTTSMSQTPVLVATCDYTLLGDEVLAAGAITSQDDAQIATIAGLDVIKYLSMLIAVLGIILTTLGSSWISDALNM